MALKKSELYSFSVESCDELRGGMDASQYKDYVLVLLFVKYVSDKYAGKKDALLDVPAGGSFADMVALKGDKEIGDKMNKIIGKLAEANDLKGVIDVADFNDATSSAKVRRWWIACPISLASSTVLISIFSAQSGRRRRSARRRLRILDAPLRDGVGQEQRPVLHSCRSLACDGQSCRRWQRNRAKPDASTIPRVVRAPFLSKRTMKQRARPASTSRSTVRRWTTPQKRWRG